MTTSGAYPGRANGAKAWVVSAHSEDDGIGGANHYQHRYGDSRIDLRLPGQFAFSSYTRRHLERGSTFSATFDLTERGAAGFFALSDLPSKTWTATDTPSGTQHVVLESTEYELRWSAGGRTYFAAPIKSVRTAGIADSSGVFHSVISHQTTASDWDDYGNQTFSSEVWGDGRTSKTITVHDVRPLDWLIGLRSFEQMTEKSALGDQRIRTTAWVYDALGRLLQTVNEPGALVGGVWQPLPTQSDGVQTLYETLSRNADGLVSAITRHDGPNPSASSRTTVLTYDAAEGIDVVTTTDALGHATKASWRSGLGVLQTTTDPNGAVTTYQTDGLGRIRSIKIAGGLHDTINFSGSPLGPPVIITWRDGGVLQRVQCDRLGRTIEARSWARDDGLTVTHAWVYDGLGRVQSETLPYLPGGPVRRVYYRYDALDRLVLCSLPDSTSWTYMYGDSGPLPIDPHAVRRVSITDPRGNQREVNTDQSGRPVFVLESVGPKMPATRVQFGAADAPIAMGRDGAKPVRLTYDRLGRVIAIDDPDRGPQSATWSAWGELATITDANGLINISRDLLGRTTGIVAPEGNTKLVWDVGPNAMGKLQSVSSPSGVLTLYGYDFAGRLNRKTWKGTFGTIRLGCTYDTKGRLSRVIYPKPSPPLTVEYQYGNYGQIIGVNELPGGQPLWELLASDATGQFTKCNLGNGVIEQRSEDPSRPGYLGWIRAWKSGKPLMRMRFGFDASGNLYTRSDLLAGMTETFIYDEQDRLTNWSFTGSSASGGSTFIYDLSGNLRQRKGAFADYFHPQPGNGGPHAAALTSHGNYTYDGTGGQISGPQRTASYTSFGLPTSMTVNGQLWSFAYTAGGERVVKANTALNHRTLSVDGLYIRHDRMGAVEHRCRVFLPGGGVVERVFAKVTAAAPMSSESYYLHFDNVMNVRAVTDLTGAVQRRAFEPFGRRVDPKNLSKPALPPAGTTMGFAGHDHDDELSLINMKGRLYDPELARFVTPDPLIKDFRLSSSYNPYSYSFNNPQTWRDPSGFDPETQEPPTPPSTETAGTSSGPARTGSSPTNVSGASDNGVDPPAASGTNSRDNSSASPPSAPVPSPPASQVSITEVNGVTVVSGLTGTQEVVPAPPITLTLTPVPTVDKAAVAGEVGNVMTVPGGVSTFVDGPPVQFYLRYFGKVARGAKTGIRGFSVLIIEGARSATLGKVLRIGRAFSNFRIGPVTIGGLGSVLGIGSAPAAYRTARNRADRVQALADGLFSTSGLVGEVPFLPPVVKAVTSALSIGYSFGQLVDHLSTPAGHPMKGLSGFFGGLGFREDYKSFNTRIGLWLGDRLGL